MKKILLYGHGGACNHGAEAILRTSVPVFREAGVPILLSTHFPDQDRAFGLDRLVDRLIPADLSLVPKERAAGAFEEKERIAAGIYREALAEIDSGTICVGIGGDNYCYPNWHRQSVFHRTVKARGGQSILWGCSVQPEMIDKRMKGVLRTHDRIFARESLTARALRGHGITQVVQRPDPAFSLAPEPIPVPEGFCGKVAAVNLSPLMLRRSKSLLGDFAAAARFLLGKADTLLLLPHVTMPADDDREALEELVQCLSPEERRRICRTPEDANAAQRKYLISRCELIVCCRTHASIAAYSTGVPALVVGYSVKARGIGLDLEMDRWVLPVGQSGRLRQLTSELWEERSKVRESLRKRVIIRPNF